MTTDLLYEDYIFHQQPNMNDDQRWLDWRIQFLLQTKELIVPGLNAKLRFIAPHRRSSMVELGYFKDYSGIATGISLSKNPILKFSGVFGNRFFSIGTGIGFDTRRAKLTNCDADLSFQNNKSILNTSLILTDKGPSLNASSYLSMNKSAIAAEMSHRFLSKQTSIKLGIQVSPIPSVMIKTRVAIDGTVGCMLQKELFPSFFVTVEGETSVKPADKKSARIGISCAFKHKKKDTSISI